MYDRPAPSGGVVGVGAQRSDGRGKPPGPERVIGWREWVSFPDLGIEWIKAKVDTGARTSALHAFALEEVERHGRTLVRFKIHPEQHSAGWEIDVELPLVERRRVRDSGGNLEERPVVSSEIELLGERWPIELTLTRRDLMGFRMLLGRQAIRGRFLVDPSGSYVGGRRAKRVRGNDPRTKRRKK